MLRENTLFGLRDKEREALDLLRQHEPPEGYYVAYSGGKDSTVILDLIRRSGVKYDAHYNVTTVDPPEVGLPHKAAGRCRLRAPRYVDVGAYPEEAHASD